MLDLTARAASHDDIEDLVALYAELEDEMCRLKPVWRLTDGLAAPAAESLATRLDATGSGIVLGTIDTVPVGFLAWHFVDTVPPDDTTRIGVIEFIFTTEPARGVGVGEAMLTLFTGRARDSGVTLFDAIVPPGHRAAKNFFESHGFKARRITMHRGGS